MAKDDYLYNIINSSGSEKNIKENKNSGYGNSLEDLLSKSDSGIYQPRQRAPVQPFIPPTPTFDSDYARMRKLATEEDDFKRVLNVFESVVNRARGMGIGRAKEVLREAHEIYVDTQKQLSQVFGDRGQFDLAEEHLKNAHMGCKIDIGYSGTITLEPRIEDEEVSALIDNAVRNTDPEYFLQQVTRASEEGDVEGIEKYIALSMKSLKERGVIEIPDRERRESKIPMNGKKYEAFVRLQMEFGKLHKKAYGVAISKKVEEALGYAVSDGKYSVSSDKIKINKLREETQDLMLEEIRKTVPNSKISDAAAGVVAFFNSFLNPMYAELSACREDGDHPLKDIYQPTRENDNSWGEIVGAKLIQVDSTAMVPRSFHEGIFEDTGVPITVHPFFNPVVERYARN